MSQMLSLSLYLFSLRMTAGEALKHKWVKKRPQYYPTKSKTASSEFKFKPVTIDFVSAIRTRFHPLKKRKIPFRAEIHVTGYAKGESEKFS